MDWKQQLRVLSYAMYGLCGTSALISVLALFGYKHNATRTSAWVDAPEAYHTGMDLGVVAGVSLVAFSVVLGIVIAHAARRLPQGQYSWRRAWLIAIALLIPCYWSSCGLGIPLGIWLITLLLKDEVKDHLQS